MLMIDVDTLTTWLNEGKSVTILDVRPIHERAEWSIPGSIHADVYDALRSNDPHALAHLTLPENIPVVTVCAAGKTSLIAAELLQAQGIEAFSLVGGMKAWGLAWNVAEVPVASSAVRVFQVRRTGKGCLSYLLGAKDEAFVIDASLDPQVYLDIALQHGWQITSVFDTHIHADHLSRSLHLARQSGAMLFLPHQERVSFPFTAMRDGDTLATPAMTLSALSTPGHTLESTCYLLDNHLLFTGDTLFTGSIGRPDLEADEQQARIRASALYHSLHKLLSLPSDTLVLPGHSSAPIPFDGIPIAATLAEIDEQIEILHVSREAFLQHAMARIPASPPNYHQIVKLNEVGLLPESDVTDLEAGANRCAIS